MAENVGVIEYIVRADVSGVINSTSGLNKSLTATERAFGHVDDSARHLSGTLSNLSTVAYSVISALAVDKIIKYADAWTIVGNKVTNYLKDGQDLVDLQNEIFKVAQESATPLQAVATLYGRLEPATRGLVDSGEDLIKITETINKAFVVSGATAKEASNAIVQLSQALGAGALRSEEFNSVNEQGPRIMQGIADYMGVARGELKSLAAQGKITTEVIIGSLRSMSSAVDAEFSKMNATFEMKGTRALNNLTKSLGSNSEVQSAVGAIGDAMVSLSENIETMVTAGQSMALLYGARLVGALAASTAETIKYKVASQAAAVASAAEAAASQKLAASSLTSARNKVINEKATVSQISAERAYLATAQASLTAQLSLSTSERERTAIRLQLLKYSQAMVTAANAEAAAIARVNVATRAASQAQLALAGATATATAASRAATVSLNLLRGALALVGGPAGLLMIAAAGVYYLYDSMKQAESATIDYAKSLDVTTNSLKDLTSAQANAASYKLEKAIQIQSDEVSKLKENVSKLSDEYERHAKTSRAIFGTDKGLSDLRGQLAIETEKLEAKEIELSNSKSKLHAIQVKLTGSTRANYVALGDMNSATSISTNIQREFNNVIGIGNEALKERANYVSIPEVKVSANAQKILDDITARTEAERNYGTAMSARIMAEKEARDAGVTNEKEIKMISDAAAAQWEVTNARKENTKATNEGANESERNNRLIEEERLKTQQLEEQYKSINSTEGELTSTTLRHTEQSAKLEAQQKLSSAASEQQVNALAKEIYAQDQLAASLDARMSIQKELEESIKKDLEQEKKDRELKAKFDPQYEASSKYAEESAALVDARQRDLITEQTFLAQKALLDRTYEQERLAAAEELYRAQSEGNAFLMDSVNALGAASTSTIAGLMSGTMSATEAMQNFANIILQQAVGALVQMGIEHIKNAMLQDTIAAASAASQTALAATTGAAIASAYAPAAAMASLASFGGNAAPAAAALTSTTALASGLAVAGGRQYGGPVNPGSLYRVGETNAPELLSSGGSNYLIPGSGGNVTPLGGAGGGVTFVVNNTVSDQVQTQQTYDSETNTATLVIKEIARQIDSRTGDVGRSMKRAGAYGNAKL